MTFIQRRLFSILIGIVLAVVLIQLLNLGSGIQAQASIISHPGKSTNSGCIAQLQPVLLILWLGPVLDVDSYK